MFITQFIGLGNGSLKIIIGKILLRIYIFKGKIIKYDNIKKYKLKTCMVMQTKKNTDDILFIEGVNVIF